MTVNRGKKNEAVVRLEWPNGQPFSLNDYIRRILAIQDMKDWQERPEEFSTWLRHTICQAVGHLDVHLGHDPVIFEGSKDLPLTKEEA